MKARALPFLLIALVAAAVRAQSPAEQDLYQQLTKGNDAAKAKAVEAVLARPDQYSTAILAAGAAAAFKDKHLEDAAFLFYAGKFRMNFDAVCFPPKGTGGDSPLVAFGAFNETFGADLNPTVMAEPKTFAAAIARVKAFTPKAAKGYLPGYEFKETKTEAEALKATQAARTEWVERMTGLATLLADPDYFAAFRVIQAANAAPFNPAGDERKASREAREKAMETMKRIEKEKGLKGFMSD